MNLETLVTKEFLESRLDARSAEQNSSMESRFAEQKSYIDSRFSEQKSYIGSGLAKLTERIDANFCIQNRMVGFIVLVLILPYLENVLPL